MGMEYLFVGLGGFLGANTRYIVSTWITDRTTAAFPVGTFTVNLAGSLLIGIILTLLTERLVVDPLWRLLIVVGFLGGFTTFSSYTFEAIALIEQSDWRRAIFYVVGSNLLGLIACYGGVVIARVIER